MLDEDRREECYFRGMHKLTSIGNLCVAFPVLTYTSLPTRPAMANTHGLTFPLARSSRSSPPPDCKRHTPQWLPFGEAE
jgi:hypothetical protein